MKPGDKIQLADTLWLLIGENLGSFPYSNSLLIKDSQTALIDTGVGPEVLSGLDEKVDLVLNSHTHPDHSAGNHLFKCKVLVPELGFATSGAIRKLSERFVEPGDMGKIWQRTIRGLMGFKNRKPSGFFTWGEEIMVGQTRVLAVAAPGHTMDHTCFYFPDYKLMFSTDIDLTDFGPWYGNRESDLDIFRQSITSLKEYEIDTLVSSHLGPFHEDVNKALDDFAAVIDERDARLLELLAKEHTLLELVDASLIYGGYPILMELLRYWESQMIIKHLTRLMAMGKITGSEKGFAATDSQQAS